ncbi:MAG: DinB family protein [Vicinamibacterales bacterium]
MSIAESLLPEFDRETGLTRQLLERVPNEKASWKPHPKSFSLGDLSLHIANLLTWAVSTMKETEFDINPPGGPGFVPLKFESIGSTLKTLDENVRTTRAVIAGATDGELMVMWTFKNGGKTVFSMPRIAVLRSFVMNHMIHHRGQLTVYLRELDVPLPQIYGPTADSPM